MIQAPGRTYPQPDPGTRSCPNGYNQIPTLQLFVNYEIPPGTDYTGPSSLKVAGMDGTPVPWDRMHADYFNAENLERLVELCINSPRLGEGNPNDRCEHQPLAKVDSVDKLFARNDVKSEIIRIVGYANAGRRPVDRATAEVVAGGARDAPGGRSDGVASLASCSLNHMPLLRRR